MFAITAKLAKFAENYRKKMKPALLVLAAGMGSRYGGLKQMDGLGPNGETIIDYSIYDAVQAGFGKVVYIVREYFLEQFRESVRKKYSGVRCSDGSPLELVFVTQELDKIPSGFTVNPERQKPFRQVSPSTLRGRSPGGRPTRYLWPRTSSTGLLPS